MAVSYCTFWPSKYAKCDKAPVVVLVGNTLGFCGEHATTIRFLAKQEPLLRDTLNVRDTGAEDDRGYYE